MGAFTYPRSEPGSGGHQDLVERLNAVTPALRREVAGLPDTVLTHQPGEGEWSMKEICGHLRAMAKLEQPYLEPWDQDVEMRERNPQASPIEELLAEFAAQRADTVELLADLVHWNWARQGRHAVRGRISIRQLVDVAIEHEEDHLEQLRRVKAQAESAADRG
jgi:hypothetical protein